MTTAKQDVANTQDIDAVGISCIGWLGAWERIDWEPKTPADWKRIRRKERAAGNPFCHWSYFTEEPSCDECGDSTTAKITELNRYELMYRTADGDVACETCLAAHGGKAPNDSRSETGSAGQALPGEGASAPSLFSASHGSANLESQPRSSGRVPGGGERAEKHPDKHHNL